jgi:hypothetical protein
MEVDRESMCLTTLIFVEVNAPMQTEDLDNQMNDIVKGEVSTGQDMCTVQFVFVLW